MRRWVSHVVHSTIYGWVPVRQHLMRGQGRPVSTASVQHVDKIVDTHAYVPGCRLRSILALSVGRKATLQEQDQHDLRIV
jgi:hypothetical protein